jgi:dipeptidyl aminopeptidase/acylaminoacyl peptidase
LVAFVGVTRNGFSDIYVYDFEEDLLIRLTDDIYEEKDPAWAPDGKHIAFVSDRGQRGEHGFQNLFLLSIPENHIKALTSGAYHDQTPDWSSDGKQLAFTSDRNGSFDLYLMSMQTEADSFEVRQLTSLLTGAFDPSFSPDEKTIFFTAYEKYSFQINRLCLDSVLVSSHKLEHPPMLAYNPSHSRWKPKKMAGDLETGSAKYENRFSFDIAQSVISYDAVYGTVGGFQAAFTDMLGNHHYYVLLGNTASSTDDFLSSFNLGITYINRTHRINYGYGLFHLKDEYYDEIYGFYTERQYGGLALLSYPLSKFKRIDASFFLRQSDRDVYVQDRERKAILSTGYLSWVLDTSIWDYVGPIDGTRFNITLGLTSNLKGGETYNKLVLCDLRKYLRIRKNSCFAVRLMGFSSSGKEPQRLYLGGSWSLRGYDRRAFYGRHLFLTSNELRFPLIDNLYIGFPFGTISFSAIRGALFFDAGNAWEDDFDQLYGSFGVGARISLGSVMVLRFDISRTTDFEKISKDTDFDFFFGWNF